MTVDGWTELVRRQLGMGRLLPLGGPTDGAWISEHAASGVLRRAAEGMAGVRLGRMRISLSDPEASGGAVVPAPPSALPPGPLRIEADVEVEFRALAQVPLPQQAERVREVLLNAAGENLGLDAAEADLRIIGLLGQSPPAAAGEGEAAEDGAGEGEPETAEPDGDGMPDLSARIAAAAAAVPGVVRLAPALGGLSRPVRVEDMQEPRRRHVQVQVAVATTHRALNVAVAVRAVAAAAAAAGTSVPVTAAVVVTAIEQP